MITCNLTKPETTFDQIRKVYKELKPTDAALVSTALALSGRFALAVYDDKEYAYPKDYSGLTKALVVEIQQVQEHLEPTPGTKRAAKAQEDEPVTLDVQLRANLSAGEELLLDREDLKTLLSDIIEEGVEFLFASTDIGWQWALERVNWSTVSGGDLGRRFKFRAVFRDNAVGIELGPGGKRKVPKKH